jgi:hypothetical protein
VLFFAHFLKVSETSGESSKLVVDRLDHGSDF